MSAVLQTATTLITQLGPSLLNRLAAGPAGAGPGAPGEPGGDQPPKPELDPIIAITKLAVDEEVIKALEPPLHKAGFRVITENITDEYDTIPVTLINNGKTRFYLVSVASWILQDATRQKRAAFSVFCYQWLNPKSIVYIFSRNGNSMDGGFDDIRQGCKDAKGVDIRFIPWRRVDKLLQETNEDAKFQRVLDMFGISALPVLVPPPTISERSTAILNGEIETMVRILRVQASNPLDREGPEGYYDNLVRKAAIRGSFNWSNDPEKDARRLLEYLTATMSEYPVGHERAGQNTLGWLLKALVDEKLKPSDESVLIAIILDHHLIRDPAILEELVAKKAA